jgi:dynein heavy chain 1
VLLDAREADLDVSLGSDPRVEESLSKFISDPQEAVIYIHKLSSSDSEEPSANYVIASRPEFTGERSSVVALIKKHDNATIEASKSMASQLQAVNLSEGSPFESLHSLVRHSVAPFFKAYVKQSGAASSGSSSGEKSSSSSSSKSTGGGDAKLGLGINAVNQKIAELELSLYNCKQNVQIPHVSLTFHGDISSCHARVFSAEKRPLKPEDLGEMAKATDFLNALQSGVNVWIKEIQRVTKLERIDAMPSNSETAQEISFWLELESELTSIDRQLKSSEAECTLNTLKQSKRFFATASFDTDTIGLKRALDMVASYKPLMKDFPLNDLLTASELPTLSNALRNIFEHMKKSKGANYPVPRYLRFLEALARDLCSQVLSILKVKQFMNMPYAEFDRVASEARVLFTTWDDQFIKFREVLRELGRKRRQGEEDLPLIIQTENKSLQERIANLQKFRRQHEEFRNVIEKVLPPSAGFSALEDLDKAKLLTENVDALAMSPEGVEVWKRAVSLYNDRIDDIESRIKDELRERLAAAKSSNEMFRVFSKFNALFFRPKIRGAIQEYQAQLITRVKEDIQNLHERFKSKYPSSEAAVMSEMRDIPPVSGAIIWARQIERQLKTYMRRVEDVLGKKWELDSEGRKLKDDYDLFKSKLNTDALFENWQREISMRQFDLTCPILTVVKKGASLYLDINFDPQIMTLFKEVRNLQWLGYRAPFHATMVSTGGRQIYPFAITIREILRTYQQTTAKIIPEVGLLLAAHKKEVQLCLTEGFKLKWESLSKLGTYVSRLSAAAATCAEKTEDVLAKWQVIQTNLNALANCDFSGEALMTPLQAIQKVLDALNLANYANLEYWTKELESRIEAILTERLTNAIEAWRDLFASTGAISLSSHSSSEKQTQKRSGALRVRGPTTEQSGGSSNQKVSESESGASSGAAAALDKAKVRAKPQIYTTNHEIVIRNQVMQLQPPLEFARSSLIAQFNTWLSCVTSLPRLQSARYDAGFSLQSYTQTEHNFRFLLSKLPMGTLEAIFRMIEKNVSDASEYVQIWLQYQTLWDMDASVVYSRLGDSLETWRQMLLEIRRSRTTFDTSETQKEIGPIIVRYAQVQANVNNKYDYWHKDILSNYGQRFADQIKSFHSTISSARLELESLSIDSATTLECVSFVLKIQDVKQNLARWERALEEFKTGQTLLQRQRFAFPSDWLEYEVVEGEWHQFMEILQRKTAEIDAEIPILQKKVSAEVSAIDEKISALSADWQKDKPLGGTKFTSALETLSIFGGRVNKLQEEVARVAAAKKALDLTSSTSQEERLNPIAQELADLKNVWSELANTWKEIEALKETPWTAVIPKKIRKQLEDLVAKLKLLPNKIRQYSAFVHVQDTITSFLDGYGILIDLRSEALKERHWSLLRKRLNVKWVLTELTLGDVWDSNLSKNAQQYKDIILQAQGELSLESFLQDLKSFWQSHPLDLVNYQRKTMLIKGWDDLFAKIADHINGIGAMKNSPYFKEFESDAATWEERLNRMQLLFDIWIDVQRRWIYLEGIFSGSSDIKNLLPRESSRFDTINLEFINLMKRVAKTLLVIEIVAFDGIDKTLERLADQLAKIQKALGEYLERQRSAFPRFYFIGDEDLLDIIGNSKELSKIQKHLKKMFAGVAGLMLDSNNVSMIYGLTSAEGEHVSFHNPIDITKYPRIDAWLKALEEEMKFTLATLLAESMDRLTAFTALEKSDLAAYAKAYMLWIDQYPAQLAIVGAQIQWSQATDGALSSKSPLDCERQLEAILATNDQIVRTLADAILIEQDAIKRRKYEQLVTELVHQRDVVRRLIKTNVRSAEAFEWLCEMRFYWQKESEVVLGKTAASMTIASAGGDSGGSSADAASAQKRAILLKRLQIRMANSKFDYGFEYLGVSERLVQTPLTDRCYLTLTQAITSRMGGSPYGPAGTGKTETVKALGTQLGRLVLVFCCDEGFDFKAMSRIFIGLAMCGAWGCFDEFNRLEERILSAVSQQIQTIQLALRDRAVEVDLVGRRVPLNDEMAIFVTMNPGYAGRSNLPDNLKQLFRGIAMIKPDRELIAQVMLYSQGFKTAEKLATKIVPLFELCDEQLSTQSHYDFGLRALKSVLVSAGNLKRFKLTDKDDLSSHQDETEFEQSLLIQSVCETVIPKLVSEDIPLFHSLLSDVFPGASVYQISEKELRGIIDDVSYELSLTPSPNWVDKILQLYQIQVLRHGVMLVGPAGSGKTKAWTVLMESLERWTKIKSKAYVLDPKAITKDELFGTLDPTTREWSDGLFTALLRKIIDNLRGESEKRHWIIFDGDVDPEWVENLNALLDDNKILTLPNGERLALPNNVRIIFEVQDLKYATLATVSRCGMIWFNEQTVTNSMIFSHYLKRLQSEPLDDSERAAFNQQATSSSEKPLQQQQKSMNDDLNAPPGLTLQRQAVPILQRFFVEGGLIESTMSLASTKWHIMDFTRLRVLNSCFSLINKSILFVLEQNQRAISPMPSSLFEKYLQNRILFAIMWGFGGSMNLAEREDFSRYLQTLNATGTVLPSGPTPLLDYFVSIEDGEWHSWNEKVPRREIETHEAASPDLVIATVDTVRHVEVVKAWLSEHRPLLLCGPPGSGKTMTLEDTLKVLPDYELVSLNFSSATTPELIMKTFEHHCEYKKTPKGIILRPTAVGKWMVVFCDEINLPSADKYGTQRVMTFIRQMVEKNGFWKPGEHTWVTLERIQFLGACNPPTDPGRVPLSQRFLNHAPLLYVDFPSRNSLVQIYGTFNKALLKLAPDVRAYDQELTEAMVDFYVASQKRFTPDQHAHYIYSPRELTRWVRAMREALAQWDGRVTLDDLVRLWAHEALRLFQDRLVTPEERKWTDQTLDEIALRAFPSIDGAVALQRPILYSNWLSAASYQSLDRQTLRDYVKARLRTFYEEELDVPLVLFNEVLDHILRIDRVFRQPQGHALLIGVSGGGKTVLSRFVAWLNNLSIFTIKVNNRYKAEDFDHDLRLVMKRAGVNDEKICFIFDESNVLESSFLERMNTLLASGEVPGLFEGDDYTSLMHGLREAVSKKGLLADSEAELFKFFTQGVRRNLHVVFTMNPASSDFHNRAATSPALFNRCVLDWFGEWSDEALFQVGEEFTMKSDLDVSVYEPPAFMPSFLINLGVPQPLSHRHAVISCLVFVHKTIDAANAILVKQSGRQNYVTPRHYLDFIHHFVTLVHEKRTELEEQQLHLNVGLGKLRETQTQVATLQESLAIKNAELEKKQAEANVKLKVMVEDQQKAEVKQKELKIVQEKLAIQKTEIAEQSKEANADLARAEPALEEALGAVKGIKKKHLEEVRGFARPPELVQRAMEAVLILLKGKKLDWTAIRKALNEQGFIPSIVEFDSKSINAKQRQLIHEEYLSDSKFTYDSVNRASQACGPLVKWIVAQLEYSEILDKVQPLREKVAKLEDEAQVVEAQATTMNESITQLESSIAKYKEEYAVLISQSESIKAEMSTVQSKVDRSIQLISDLSSERQRWEHESRTFEEHMSTLVGDSLLAAAFLAYSGFFDQYYRVNLMHQWQEQLTSVGVKYETALSTIEYLSHPDERLRWQAHQLPVDDLCTENAIMLHRFNRYPLVIDPSGQASEFIMSYYKDRKITKTSFLDPAFMKNLESALRFGLPLLVEDVENIDPVLNPVLNKEIRKTGGRVLIRLGDNDVDFSPSFVIFLSTRDPTAHFTPDLCSRVTFVNFTVTPKSLQSQCLYNVLKAEQPAIHKKRNDLLQLQGEIRVKLRALEKSLLDALNESQGNILDDLKVLATLESIKKQAASIHAEAEETDKIMEEVKVVSEFYRPLAVASSNIYFTMEQMSLVHFLYQFSLHHFLDLFYAILHNNTHLAGVSDQAQRLEILKTDLFSLAYSRLSRSLLHNDRVALALRLAQLKLQGTAHALAPAEFELLVKGSTSKLASSLPQDAVLAGFLSETQRLNVLDLQELPVFHNLTRDLQTRASAWQTLLASQTPEASLEAFLSDLSCAMSREWNDGLGSSGSSGIASGLRLLLILRAFRSDRLLAGATQWLQLVFGASFTRMDEYEFGSVFERESKATAPFLLCSAPGFDASIKVDELAARIRPRAYEPIAIGSQEGFDMADKAITKMSSEGGWVHLKNIHLAPQWLAKLEKKLHAIKKHDNFRLFLSSEVHPQLPANLLRMSKIFVFEPAPGIKASLLQTVSELPAAKMDSAPHERARLYFLLAWFHAVVQERLRYAPFGWSKVFEFNNTDKRNSIDTIDYWVDTVSAGGVKAHVDPDTLPWDAIRVLLSQTIYGGRIDNVFDQRLLDAFLHQWFNAKSFDHDFALVDSPRFQRDKLVIHAPGQANNRQSFVAWIESLPATDAPSWLGLPDNAELLLLQTKAQQTLANLLKMQTLDDDTDTVEASMSSGSSGSGGVSSSFGSGASESSSSGAASLDEDGRPSWIKALEANSHKWKALLPLEGSLLALEKSEKQNPLQRFFEREIHTARALLANLHQDMVTLEQVCRGEVKQTNHLRSLMSTLSKGGIPKVWREYPIVEATSLNQWFVDFGARIAQLKIAKPLLAQLDSAQPSQPLRVWLGGLFSPEAFITATRQRAARGHGWSLENLELQTTVLATEQDIQNNPVDLSASFIVEGLFLQGAQWDVQGKCLSLSNDMTVALPPVLCTWQNKPNANANMGSGEQPSSVLIPTYLNTERRNLLFAAPLRAPADIPHTVWYQRGVAITAAKV